MASSGGINSKKLFPRKVEPGRSLNSMAESSGEWFVRQSLGSNSITASQVTRSKLPAALNSSATLSQWTCGCGKWLEKWWNKTHFSHFLFGWMIGEAFLPKGQREYRHLRLHTLPNHGVHEDGERNHSTKGHYLSQKQTSEMSCASWVAWF